MESKEYGDSMICSAMNKSANATPENGQHDRLAATADPIHKAEESADSQNEKKGVISRLHKGEYFHEHQENHGHQNADKVQSAGRCGYKRHQVRRSHDQAQEPRTETITLTFFPSSLQAKGTIAASRHRTVRQTYCSCCRNSRHRAPQCIGRPCFPSSDLFRTSA